MILESEKIANQNVFVKQLGPIVSGLLIASLKAPFGSDLAYALILLIGGGTEFLITVFILAFGWLRVPEAIPSTQNIV